MTAEEAIKLIQSADRVEIATSECVEDATWIGWDENSEEDFIISTFSDHRAIVILPDDECKVTTCGRLEIPDCPGYQITLYNQMHLDHG